MSGGHHTWSKSVSDFRINITYKIFCSVFIFPGKFHHYPNEHWKFRWKKHIILYHVLTTFSRYHQWNIIIFQKITWLYAYTSNVRFIVFTFTQNSPWKYSPKTEESVPRTSSPKDRAQQASFSWIFWNTSKITKVSTVNC